MVLDNPVQLGDADILIFFCIRNHRTGCRKRFLRRIEEPVLHVHPDLVTCVEIIGSDRSPDRDLLDDIAPDMPGIGLEGLGVYQHPFDAGFGHFIVAPAACRDHALLNQFADIFGDRLRGHAEFIGYLLLAHGWLVFGDLYKNLET